MKKKEKIFSVERAEDSSGFLLWQVTNLWQREIRKALEKFGITHSQFVLLASVSWLSQIQKDVTQTNLSDHSKIDPMTTSSVLRTLQQKGFLQRKIHHSDTRAKIIELTEKGRKITKESIKAVESFDKNFFSPLGVKVAIFNEELSLLLEN